MNAHLLCLVMCAFLLLGSQAHAQDEEAVVRQKSVVAQSCFVGANLFNCSLRADNDPNKIGAARPAAFSYTFNNDGKDSYAIEAATKAFYALSADGTRNLSLSAQWHKNNQQKKEQDALSVGLGLTFEANQGLYDAFIRSMQESVPLKNELYWFFDTTVDLTYNRKAEIGDRTRTECVANPALRACGRQFLESARLSVVTAPYATKFGSDSLFAAKRRAAYWVFSPTLGVFYDQAFNDGVETCSGQAANGGVMGAQAGFKYALSPGLYGNRWELSFSGQIVEVITQDQSRKADFEKSGRLFSASLAYALGDSFIGEDTRNKLLPALNLTYTNGSDPLKGRRSQDTLFIGLSLKY